MVSTELPVKSKKNKTVSFKPTEIYGREFDLRQCVDNHNHVVNNGRLHAPECANFEQETVEVL